jgi:hypothetical protein
MLCATGKRRGGERERARERERFIGNEQVTEGW